MPSPERDRIRLVVLFGGRSAEHEVSCVSALNVLRAVDRDRYEVVPVGITREGRWVAAEEAAAALQAGTAPHLQTAELHRLPTPTEFGG